MCEVPPRSFRRALRPERVLLGVLAVLAITAGFVLGTIPGQALTGLIVLGLGAAALFAAVVFPAIRDVEFGFPSGLRVRTALHDRAAELTRAFESQRGDFALYAQLLCPDPAMATTLLEAAWAKTAAEWRGPVNSNLRPYVLCVFVHLLDSHTRWAGNTAPVTAAGSTASDSLSALTLPQRTVVVLHEFAELPVAQIAGITERPLGEVTADLRAAEDIIGRRIIEDDSR